MTTRILRAGYYWPTMVSDATTSSKSVYHARNMAILFIKNMSSYIPYYPSDHSQSGE